LTVPVQTTPSFSTGRASVITDNLLTGGNAGRSYDVTPDASRFLVLKEPLPTEITSDPPQLNVVLNCGEELRRLAPAKR
jgi:hypothetical protein